MEASVLKRLLPAFLLPLPDEDDVDMLEEAAVSNFFLRPLSLS